MSVPFLSTDAAHCGQSLFRTSETGRVGFTGSGRGMVGESPPMSFFFCFTRTKSGGDIVGERFHIFGFFPNKDSNFRYPQVGVVIIEDNVEIGCGSTIDRGSLSNTIIGKNTYLDNQIHIAHNVKIGENCIIAGQVGFAGSSTLGNNVMIGGQAGISGHLKIGSNVQIGGGSGVIKNIPDNSKVMGYPAKDLKNFIRESK